MRKNWFIIFNVKVTARANKLYNQNMTIFTISSKLLVGLQLGLIVQHHKPDCTVEKLDKVIVTVKIQIVSEWLSGYLLNR